MLRVCNDLGSVLSHQIFQRRFDRTQRCCSRIIQPGAVPWVIVKVQTFPYSDVTVRGCSGHYTLMFHLHFVGVILFDFIMSHEVCCCQLRPFRCHYINKKRGTIKSHCYQSECCKCMGCTILKAESRNTHLDKGTGLLR